jgi:hypothetical protein
MANPTKGDVFVDIPLTIASIRRIQDDAVYVAGRVFPNIPVTQPSATYRRWERGSFLRSQMRKRGDGAETVGARFGMENGPFYHAEVWGLHKDIGDQVRAVSDQSEWDIDRGTVEFLTQQALLLREREWARAFFIPNVWGTDLDGVTSATPSAGEFTQWDQPTSNPIRTIRRYKTLMTQMTGMAPNVLVMSPWVLDSLMEHPDILERVANINQSSADVNLLAGLFNVDRILVPMAVENVSADGVAEDIQFIMGNHALLVYANPAPNLEVPSGGYIVSWRGYHGAGVDGNRIKRIRLEKNAADRLEIEMAFDMVQISPELGIFFGNAIGTP